MVRKIFLPDVSYRFHLKELDSLLKKSGILPSRQLITASTNGKENRIGKDRQVQSTIGQVVIYMEDHLSEPLSLDELADKARLSKYQLIRGFRKETGTTPWKFLIEKRIGKAQKMLEEGTPPGQVAVETGFYDQSHLNKTFRDETGLTPKEYQEINFKNKN